jgi:hypothetical protein
MSKMHIFINIDLSELLNSSKFELPIVQSEFQWENSTPETLKNLDMAFKSIYLV